MKLEELLTAEQLDDFLAGTQAVIFSILSDKEDRYKWIQKEPEPQFPQETTRMYEQLVYHALAENLVGESKGAELLNISVSTLHACRKMECLENAVNQ